MKRFHIHLIKNSPVSLITATAETGHYEILTDKSEFDFDFVLRFADGTEHVRIAREHILYITIDDATSTEEIEAVRRT